eukprot:TRINITY_DN66169_c0_g1_i1.p1 TRINITY_DN66169_c0_g1~~TRINITY_DN66169_c0_g1_i1.p1  ORF type:complete len:121 (-),score=10.42 TRINITY_DN66169_c0_g1_i1:1404-1766(-)
MSDPVSKAFLAKRVNPILEKLVVDLVIKRPENVTGFMVQWLQDKGEQIERQTMDHASKGHYDVESEEDSDEDTGEDLLDIKQLQAMKAQKDMRTSVSAEVYGKFNEKAAFKPKVIPKTPE